MGCISAKQTPGPIVGDGGARSEASFDQQYKVGKQLGSGAYATVCEAINNKTKLKCAVKIVDRSKLTSEDDDALKEEVNILRNMRHDHIIRLFDFFEEPKKYYLVLEICEGGELFDKIVEKKRYTEKEARDLVRILLDAIAYCHDAQVVHRDLKPENLLLTSGEDVSSIKIADFGFAQRVTVPNALTTQCGTPGYVAPEILKGVNYGEAVDNWSIGVITYILLGGYPPFYDENQPRMFRKIKRGDYKFHAPYWDHVSDEAKDLIKQLLVVNPADRLTSRSALSHPWIRTDDHILDQRDLTSTVEEMKKFNARRKFKAGVEAVMLAKRLQLMSKSESTGSKVDEDVPDEEEEEKK